MKTLTLFAFALGASFLTATAPAAVELPGVFSDHMVLQRDMAVPVYGTASPGETVSVKFRGQEKSTTAKKDGTWRVELDALKAGGPDALTVSGENTIEIADVLVGEVWVGSGQSNMAGGVANYAKKDATLASALERAPYPRMRLLKSVGPASVWSEATPEAAARFSALLFAFGQALHEELDVPVGLIVGAVGGTPSGSWLSQEALDADAACQESIAEFAKAWDPKIAQEKFEAALKRWEEIKARSEARGDKVPRKPNPPVGPGEHSRGATVGNLYERFIRPVVGYGIRGVLWDQGEAGTAVVGVDQYTLMGGLISGWRREWGQGEFPFIYVQKPSGGGVAWDPERPMTREADAFAALPETTARLDGGYREHHIRIREHPNTWMATASDLGGMVHPLNKWGYGRRASQVALRAAYDRDLEVYGPSYDSHAVEVGAIRVTLRDTGKGLAFRGGDQLQGFMIAGDDKVFHWAEATIDGDAVVVSSEAVPQPVAVRYAWGRTHPWANLFNKDGLPALTFRTDGW